MPAIAAHYKFGQLVLERLDTEIADIVIGSKELFDLATQGPDLLFHFNPFKSNYITQLGKNIHAESGINLFDSILTRGIAKNPAILSYVLGVVCHYGLDVACHPYVTKFENGDSSKHTSLESDFDLYIIRRFQMYAKRHIYLPPKVDYAAISAVYTITSDEVETCLKNMRIFNKLFDYPKLIKTADKVLKKSGVYYGLTLKKEPVYMQEAMELSSLFDEAVEPTANLVATYYKSIKNGLELPEGFGCNFEGEIIN